ncbi:protein kinase [Streptomyces sp. S186]|uniref:protein kinase n=1 Tax=Streptomyces sp. S186 TaxID=3434395 RepID=UPI003F675FCE
MLADGGRVLADRYRLAAPPADGSGPFTAILAFDTYSRQDVLIRQVPLPEVVEAEVLAPDGRPADGRAEDGFGGGPAAVLGGSVSGRAERAPSDPVARRAVQAATAAAQLPDHALLEQVFDVFAQDGSLWIVGELLSARPLAELLAGRTLSPHRAAELAADLLTALRAVHAHGWLHRNITARTVLVCDDGRAVLTGLAAGAAQEALCGYDPMPREPAKASASVSPAKEAAGGGGAAVDTASGAVLTGLAAERARQARLQLVGAVAERWAPEQAGPADGNAEAAGPAGPAGPVGPAADLWAVGVLLFRAVQGYPPYPEESAAELLRLVRTQRPAEAVDGGVLRPVVAALLCQDPAGRPTAEELLGRLRALVRTAPEPDLGRRMVALPAPAGPADPRRLPIVRRRGELVRRRRPKGRWPGALPEPPGHELLGHELLGQVEVGPAPQRSRTRTGRGPRSLGRVLLTVILLLMVAGIAYAMVFLPKSGAGGGSDTDRKSNGTVGGAARPPGTTAPQTTIPGTAAPGFALRTDPLGFRIAVREGWQRATGSPQGQARYTGGGYTLLVVPGRDTTVRFGADPMAYQQSGEPELAAFRDAGWSSASGLRRIDVGQTAMAEGTFAWTDATGRRLYARNLAVIQNGRYHLVLVIGPATGRGEVDRLYAQASSSYRPPG